MSGRTSVSAHLGLAPEDPVKAGVSDSSSSLSPWHTWQVATWKAVHCLFVESTGFIDETVERSAGLCGNDVFNQVDTKGGAKFGSTGEEERKGQKTIPPYSFSKMKTRIDLFCRHWGSLRAFVKISVFQPEDND